MKTSKLQVQSTYCQFSFGRSRSDVAESACWLPLGLEGAARKGQENVLEPGRGLVVPVSALETRETSTRHVCSLLREDSASVPKMFVLKLV